MFTIIMMFGFGLFGLFIGEIFVPEHSVWCAVLGAVVGFIIRFAGNISGDGDWGGGGDFGGGDGGGLAIHHYHFPTILHDGLIFFGVFVLFGPVFLDGNKDVRLKQAK